MTPIILMERVACLSKLSTSIQYCTLQRIQLTFFFFFSKSQISEHKIEGTGESFEVYSKQRSHPSQGIESSQNLSEAKESSRIERAVYFPLNIAWQIIVDLCVH